MPTTARSFKACIIIQIIFNIIFFIKMVANNFPIISYNNISSICIIASIPFF